MWNIYIDVSGMPYETVYVGLFLINSNYSARFITEFYNKFPKLKHYNKKSTKVKSNELFEILKFFDDKKLRMCCYHFTDYYWKLHKRKLNELMKEVDDAHVYRENFSAFKEKIMGILYYYTIIHILPNNDSCNVNICAESHLDIWQVVDMIIKLTKRDGRKIKVLPQLRKHEHLLKMADYVAGANRRIDEFKINTILRHNILKDPIRDFELKKVFKIYKRDFGVYK